MTVIIGDRHPNVMLQYIREAESTLSDLKDTLTGTLCISEYLLQSDAASTFGETELIMACLDAQQRIDLLEPTLMHHVERVRQLHWAYNLCDHKVIQENDIESLTAEIKLAVDEILNSLLLNAEHEEQEEEKHGTRAN